MSHRGTKALCLALLLVTGTQGAAAAGLMDRTGDAVVDSSRGTRALLGYGGLFLQDTWHVLSAPSRWHRRDWLHLSLGIVGVCGVAGADGPTRDLTQRNRNKSVDGILTVFERFGAELSFVVVGGFYIVGSIRDDAKAKNTAVDGLIANLIAAQIVTPALKEAFGRWRPFQTTRTYKFRPFSGHTSFPSGHATRAFAVAAAVAAHYESSWIQLSAYGIAGMVGVARVVHNAHFVSDVAAGALIGTTIGRAVVHLNQERRQGTSRHALHMVPYSTDGASGVGLALSF